MKLLRCMITLLLCFALLLPFTAQAEQAAIDTYEIPKEVLLASLWEADISSIRNALDKGLLTCVELTQYYLERIEIYNDTYNCFITLCNDALEQAAQRDEWIAAGEGQGSLLGIPMVIKDNMDYAGYHTTNGHDKSDSRIADSNATVVEALLEQGAVIIGKTNMSTDAQDARVSVSQAVGKTRNAYNTLMAPGGSSGGSAAATSLNFAVASLGTDTNSSLRYPAVLNGCVSLRPTWNTLSMDGICKLNSTKDVPGAITRTVMDQAIVLDVISGGETSYARSLNGDILNGLRIGVLKELSYPINSFRCEENIDDEIETAFSQAIEELKACGAEIVEVSIPNVLSLADKTQNSNKSKYKDQMYAAITEAMADAEVSALIFPSYLNTPHRSGTDEDGTYWDVYSQTYINNTSQFASCASLPEIGIPIGYHSLGSGIGMEIAALKNQEQLLLDIAYAYTSRYDHRQAPAGAGDLYAEHYYSSLAELVEEGYTVPVASNESTVVSTTDVPAENAVFELAAGMSGSKRSTVEITAIICLSAIAACFTLMVSLMIYMRYKKRVMKRRRRERKNQLLYSK